MEFCEAEGYLREMLEAQVAVVAILAKLAATVTAPRRRVWPLLYPESLHTALKKFIWMLRDALAHDDVTSLRQRGVSPLSQAVVALWDNPGATWDNLRAAAKAWRELVNALAESWIDLTVEAEELCDSLEYEDTDEATAPGLGGDLRDETAGWGTAGDKAREEVVVATRQAGAATRRGQRVEEARGLLRRLEAACEGAGVLPRELQIHLKDIDLVLKGTNEVCPDIPDDLVHSVAMVEELWVVSAELTTRHLLVALGEIDFLLSSPYGGSGGPGGPRGRAVAERCQKAMEDIPRLLQDSYDTVMKSFGH